MKYLLCNIPKINTPEHLPRDKVVYLHRRGTDKVPFYVGIGVDGRQHKVGKVGDGNRNDDWHEVYNEHGRTVELLFTELLEWSSKAIEVALIAQYRHNYGRFREGGFITNLSDGGDGSSGYKLTEEQLVKKIASLNRPEARARNSAAQKIAQNTPKAKARMSSVAKKNWENEEFIEMQRAKMRAQMQSGDKCPNFFGYSVGINDEQFVIVAGKIEMRELKFNPGHVSACISGTRRVHKSFTWTRQTTINPEDFIGLEPYNQLSAERLQNAKNS